MGCDNPESPDRFDQLIEELRAFRQKGEEINETLKQILDPLMKIGRYLEDQSKLYYQIHEENQHLLELFQGRKKTLPEPTPVIEKASEEPVSQPLSADELTDLSPRSTDSMRWIADAILWIADKGKGLKEILGGFRYGFAWKNTFLSIAIALIIFGLSIIGVLTWLDVIFSNVLYAFRGERKPSERIAIVALDEPSIEALSPYGKEWRRYHRTLIENLVDDGTKVIGLDFSFSRPTHFDEDFLEGIRYARGKGVEVVVATQYLDRYNTFTPTAKPIEDSVSAVGHAYLKKDRVTNLVRWVPMYLEDSSTQGNVKTLIPSFASRIAIFAGADPGERNSNTLVPINFIGKRGSFRAFSYSRVYEKDFDPGTFREKIVLIGSILETHKDFHDVPGQSQMPGVEIQANAVYTFLTGNIIKPGVLPSGALILSLCLVASIICSSYRSYWRVSILILATIGYWVLAIQFFRRDPPLELSLAYPSLALALTWGAISLQEKIFTRRELTKTVGLPEKLLKRLERDPDFRTGEARKLLTVLASDIVNYSVFSSQNPPKHVREIINEYNTTIEKIIYACGGYVNKYIGDAVLAIFGYPMSDKDTVKRAVVAAYQMQEALRKLVQKWKKENKNCFERIRIGINYGYVNISYLGKSKRQLDVLGDNVDLAARLESAAGKIECKALMSPTTHEQVKDIVAARRVDVELKNRPDVKEAFTLDDLLIRHEDYQLW